MLRAVATFQWREKIAERQHEYSDFKADPQVSPTPASVTAWVCNNIRTLTLSNFSPIARLT